MKLEKNIPLSFRSKVLKNPDLIALASKDSNGEYCFFSQKDVYDEIINFAIGLKKIGIERGDKVALISDNRKEWFITDMALLSLGAVDVPRGCDSMANEICFILSYIEGKYAFFETSRQLQKVLDNKKDVPSLKYAILYDKPSEEIKAQALALNVEIMLFEDVLKKGFEDTSSKKEIIESEMQKTEKDDIATIIFSSGTTGTPKGVMLTHDNYIAQLECIDQVLPVKKGDMWLSILPVWHSFERIFQYIPFTLDSGLAYSKPIGAIMLKDMAAIKPEWMCGVPRVWDSLAQSIFRSMNKKGGIKLAMFNFFVKIGKMFSWSTDHVFGKVCQIKKRCRPLDTVAGFFPMILLSPLYLFGELLVYRKLKKRLGGRIRAAISGGGALQPNIDAFYKAIGFKLLEGYGLTETAPVLSVRRITARRSGCVGEIMPCSEIKIVKEEHGKVVSEEPLPFGQRGLVFARGRQIMKGYYKRDDLTDAVMYKDGWLNTGDLGLLTFDNEIKITGRAKDTIVLLGGENIEPQIIESSLNSSSFIETSVIMGQDKKYLGALIVPAKDEIIAYAEKKYLDTGDYEKLIRTDEIKNLIKSEIDTLINTNSNFRTCERVFKFALLKDSFQVGKEMSGKQELMRYKIREIYKAQIDSMFEQ